MPARRISPPQFIRQHILRMNVTEMAKALKVSLPRVTAYEMEGAFPKKHHPRIIELGKERGVRIRPSWLDSVPWDPKMSVPE